jgi:hypothetical protein
MSRRGHNQLSALKPLFGVACPLWWNKGVDARQHFHGLPPMIGSCVSDQNHILASSRPSHGMSRVGRGEPKQSARRQNPALRSTARVSQPIRASQSSAGFESVGSLGNDLAPAYCIIRQEVRIVYDREHHRIILHIARIEKPGRASKDRRRLPSWLWPSTWLSRS